MLFTIRKNVFETNSSSTYSLIMCSAEEYAELKKGKLLIDRYAEEIVTFDEVFKIYAKRKNNLTDEEKNEIMNSSLEDLRYWLDETFPAEILTLEDYLDCGYLESFVQTYTTKNREKIYAFGVYGHD